MLFLDTQTQVDEYANGPDPAPTDILDQQIPIANQIVDATSSESEINVTSTCGPYNETELNAHSQDLTPADILDQIKDQRDIYVWFKY